MGLLSRLFRSTAQPTASVSRGSDLVTARMVWRTDTTLPIPDWNETAKAEPSSGDSAAMDAYWSNAARQWLERLKAHLGEPYAVGESPHFLMLSALDPRIERLTLEICERARKRILSTLRGIAGQREPGPHVVVAFSTEDEYYAYIDNYYTEPGEYSYSGGMYLGEGYGHFVFPSDRTWTLEPTIAHELTHCLVSHLPLPAWLNEGMAMTMEKHLNPAYDNPRYAPFSLQEMKEKHKAFWNADTIQEFWSGKAYVRPDDGSMLSYDLGEHLTRLISRDYKAFTAFANAASYEDAGMSAAHDALGVDLADCVVAVLGEGPWQPQPSRWSDGVERGQF